MLYALDAEAQRLFYHNGCVELEGIFSDEKIEAFSQAISLIIQKKRTRKFLSPFERLNDIFMHGRDLWRDEEDIARIVCQKSLAKIAAELFDQKMVRLGYDQFFPKPVEERSLPHTPYEQLISSPRTLSQISPIQNTLGGWLIALSEPASETGLKKGNTLCFHADFPLSLSLFEQDLFLIAYCERKSFYTEQPNDPLTHQLKSQGYHFGEYLRDAQHPLIYRK